MARNWRVTPGWALLPTTTAGAEFCISLAVVGMRAAVLLSIAVSLPSGWQVSPHPVFYLMFTVLALAESLVGIVRIATSRPPTLTAAIPGLLIGCASLVAGPTILASNGHAGAWMGWPPQFALAVTVQVAATSQSRTVSMMASGVLAAAYLAVSIPPDRGYTSTLFTTLLSLFGVPCLTSLLVTGLRGLATQADDARAVLSDRARKEVRALHHLALRDTAGLLRVLASDTLTPGLRDVLNEQIHTEIAKIRVILADGPAASEYPSALIGTVLRACSVFNDLPIEMSLDLAAGVQVPSDQESALMAAIEEVLSNIRHHACAGAVVVHAASAGDGGWELSIRDDGKGFPIAVGGRLPPGLQVGRLRTTVIDPLEALDIDTMLISQPGEGSAVIFRARRSRSPRLADTNRRPGSPAPRMIPGIHRAHRRRS